MTFTVGRGTQHAAQQHRTEASALSTQANTECDTQIFPE
jgi:hypothetical protein